MLVKLLIGDSVPNISISAFTWNFKSIPNQFPHKATWSVHIKHAHNYLKCLFNMFNVKVYEQNTICKALYHMFTN